MKAAKEGLEVIPGLRGSVINQTMLWKIPSTMPRMTVTSTVVDLSDRWEEGCVDIIMKFLSSCPGRIINARFINRCWLLAAKILLRKCCGY
jgi:hypothetical protein